MKPFVALLALVMALPADAATRDELRREREAIEAEHGRRAEACKTQFVVTPCLDKVRIAKQKALSHVLEQENALDAAERQARADARHKRLADKASVAQAASAPAVDRPASAAASAAGGKPTKARDKPAEREDRGAREEEKRAAFEARQREIQAHREQVERRNAERARTKPAPRPLPLPAGSAASH
jgi:colicin import membrane protein